MMTNFKLAAVSALALTLGGTAALAQGALVGTRALDDRIDAVEDQVRDDFKRSEDAARFGNPQFAPGWTGSIAATFAGKSGNTKTQDTAIAGRFRYNEGQWSHTVGFGFEFGESNSVKNKENAFVVYDANYYVNDQFYVFGLARAETNKFPDRRDAFLGFGPGVRVINTQDTAWRVQAGPGIRYQKLGTAPKTSEAGVMASSRVFHKISDTVFLTNDTDVLKSKVGVLATNDFGVTFKMSNALSTRISYRTEYNNRPAPGQRRTDSTLGVSLVYSFN